MAKKKAQALPKRIYVNRETDTNDPDAAYLMAAETTEAIDDATVVGIYELVETKRIRVTRDMI